jgi:hypothetical protein
LIGLFFWIPFLARSIAFYTALVVISMIRSRDVSGASRELDRAIVFWIDGFKKISLAGHPHAAATRTAYLSMSDAAILVLWTFACGIFWLGIWMLAFNSSPLMAAWE